MSVSNQSITRPPHHRNNSESTSFSSQANPYNNVCDQCYRRKLSCSRDKPACVRCQQSGHQCTYSVARPAGRPRRPESGESRQHRRSVVRNSIRTHEEELQRRGLYTPVSQAGSEDYRNAQTNVQSAQKEGKVYETVGSQMHNSSDNSENATLFHSSLGTAAQSLDYTVSPDQTYIHHSNHSSEDTTNIQSKRHPQKSEQPPNAPNLSEPMATADLNCDILSQLPHALDGEFLDLDFSSQEALYIDPEPQPANSIISSTSDGRCQCCLYLMQFLNRRRQEEHVHRDSLSRIQLLNGAAEQFLMCDVGHGKLWYLILLALYQDADDTLSLPGEIEEMAGNHSRKDEKLNSNVPHSNGRNVLLKTFILLSSTASVLPFKFGGDTDDKLSPEVMETFAEFLRDKFESRLLDQTDESRLYK